MQVVLNVKGSFRTQEVATIGRWLLYTGGH